MWVVLGIIVVTIGIIIFEVPPLVQKGFKKELVVFSILLAIGAVLSILKALEVKIINPFDILTTIYKPFANLILAIFE